MPLKTFKDVIGHEASIARISRDIAGGSVPNAYLFVGPEGVGKSVVARATAAAMLCLDSDVASRPCGKCRSCGKIERGNHPDFHTLATEKGKKQIRIDQVRALQAELALRPYEAEWKTAIIAPAEDMNEAAQNALLKTLEEPPGKALMILVAPSPQNLLPTIVSRTRIERFGPLMSDQLASLLVAEMKITDDEARLFSDLSGGSAGRAMALDRDFALKERPEVIRRLVQLSLSGKGRSAEDVIGTADRVAEGGEPLLDMLASFYKDIAIAMAGLENFTHRDMLKEIRAMASRFTPDEITGRFAALLKARDNMDRNFNKSFVYETLILSII